MGKALPPLARTSPSRRNPSIWPSRCATRLSSSSTAHRANGQINDYVIDKVFGEDKIEGVSLTVAIDRSAVHAKGDARIFGAPATFELTRPAAGPGEAAIVATFDDAVRAKRGLGLG